MIGSKDEYRVLLMHDPPSDLKPEVKDFTILFVYEWEEEKTVLYSYKIEDTSIVAARELARWCKEILMRPDTQVRLWARALGEILGFDADSSLNKGVEFFLSDMASHIATEDLESYIKVAPFEPFKIALDNELRKRSEVKECMVSKQY